MMTLRLGDTIHNVLKAVGFKACTPCERRRQKLNKLFGSRSQLKVEVLTEAYQVVYPKGSIMVIDKEHPWFYQLDRLIEKGYVKLTKQ